MILSELVDSIVSLPGSPIDIGVRDAGIYVHYLRADPNVRFADRFSNDSFWRRSYRSEPTVLRPLAEMRQ
jgi:hypothetical protein